MRLNISQEQSWPSVLYLISHKWVQYRFMRFVFQTTAGEILFCLDVSAGHFQKLFRAVMLHVHIINIIMYMY